MEDSLISEKFSQLEVGEHQLSMSQILELVGAVMRRTSRDNSPHSAKLFSATSNLFVVASGGDRAIEQRDPSESRPLPAQFLREHYRIREPKETGLSRRFFKLLKRLKVSKTSQSCSVCQQHFQKD